MNAPGPVGRRRITVAAAQGEYFAGVPSGDASPARDYSAALSTGAGPERNCSSSAASSAFAATRWRAFTWPKPRIFSGMAASPTAMWWFSGVSLRDDLVEQRLVVGDQLALGAALRRIAERIERGAAQELELRQQAEQPAASTGPKRHLPRHAGHLVLAREQRRREVELEREILARDLVPHLREERRRRHRAARPRTRPCRPSA